MRVLALILVLIVLPFALMGAFSPDVDAHVTKCPEPANVELAQWWDVDTQTDTEDCSVSVNADSYDAAAALGRAICPGEIVGVRAQSHRMNQPFRSKRYQ